MAKYYKRYGPSYSKIRKVVNQEWWKKGWSRVNQHNHLGSAGTDPSTPGFQGMIFTTNADYTQSPNTSVSGVQSVRSMGTLLTGSATPTDYARGGVRYLKNFKFRWSVMDCTPHPTGGGVDIDCAFVLCIYKIPSSEQVVGYESLVNGYANAKYICQRFFEFHDTATGQGVITSNGGVAYQRMMSLKVGSITLNNEDLCWALYCIKNNSNTPVVMQMDTNWEYRVKGTAVQV